MPITWPTMAVFMRLAAFAALSLVGIELARVVDDPSVLGSFPAIWPLSGLLVAALLTRERRQWLPFILVACGAMLLSSVVIHAGRMLPSVAASAIFALQSAATAWAVRWKTADHPFSLDRLTHAVALVAASAIVPLAGGALAAVILMWRDPALAVPVWRTWWLADTVGTLLVAPLLLAAMHLRRGALSAVHPGRALEMTALLIGCVILTEGVLGGRFPPLLQVPAYILPFLLWAAFRFGPGGGAVAACVVGFLAVWHALRGEGPFAIAAGADHVLRTQGAVAIAASSLLLLASVIAERQQALAEIKTLKGFIPICAWCHKVRDDAGFWQQLEQYFDDNTDATLSHSICPSCTEKEQLGIMNAELGMRDDKVTHS